MLEIKFLFIRTFILAGDFPTYKQTTKKQTKHTQSFNVLQTNDLL